jgi:hypothetical protein
MATLEISSVKTVFIFGNGFIFLSIFENIKLLNMKNLQKLTKSDLKRINGGNPPECPVNTMECYYPPKNGNAGYWRCVSITSGCPN